MPRDAALLLAPLPSCSGAVADTTASVSVNVDQRILGGSGVAVFTSLGGCSNPGRDSFDRLSGAMQPLWSDDLLVGKPALNPAHNSVGFDARFFGKLDSKVFPTVDSDHSRRSLIALLLTHGGPLAVFWAVPFVIIDALKAGVRRALTHIASKRLVTVLPSIAYCNTPSAVAGVGYIVGVVASLFHSLPYVVKRGHFLFRHDICVLGTVATG